MTTTQTRMLVKWFVNVTVGQFTLKVEREGIYDAAFIRLYPNGQISLFCSEFGGMCPINPDQIIEMRAL